MPTRPSRACKCGAVLPAGEDCPRCSAARKARAEAKRLSARARGYTSEWDKARAAYLREHPICAFCGAPASVVDHIVPHRRNPALMWSRSNWQALCATCHNSTKQAVERAERLGFDINGYPLDPSHPWSRAKAGGHPNSGRQAGDRRGHSKNDARQLDSKKRCD